MPINHPASSTGGNSINVKMTSIPMRYIEGVLTSIPATEEVKIKAFELMSTLTPCGLVHELLTYYTATLTPLEEIHGINANLHNLIHDEFCFIHRNTVDKLGRNARSHLSDAWHEEVNIMMHSFPNAVDYHLDWTQLCPVVGFTNLSYHVFEYLEGVFPLDPDDCEDYEANDALYIAEHDLIEELSGVLDTLVSVIMESFVYDNNLNDKTIAVMFIPTTFGLIIYHAAIRI